MLAQLLAESPSRATVLLVFTAAWLAATAFWLWALLDCLRANRLAGWEKMIWVIVLLCTYVVGAIPYLVLVRLRRPAFPSGS